MGIDIYMKWDKQTKAQEKKQFTGFSVRSGHTGYLREAYHGDPYATHYFVAEAFKTGEAKIKAEVLKKRLPKTLELVRERHQALYKNDTEMDIFLAQKSYFDFAELCEKMEKKIGKPCIILASY